MANSESPTRYRSPDFAVRLLMRLFALAGLCGSGYLFYGSFLGGPSLPGCGAGSGCDKVLASPWAGVLGVPVALPALTVYLSMLVATFGIGPTGSYRRQRIAWRTLFVLAVLATAAAIWFVALQVIWIKSYCKFCLTVHGCGIMLAAIVCAHAPIRFQLLPGEPNDPIRITRSTVIVLTLIALFSTSFLAGLQIAFKPPQIRVHFFDGRVSFDRRAVPMLGRHDAPHVLVSLFDYACPHCRLMHMRLSEARKRYGDNLAIVALPMPLNSECNSTIGKTSPRFNDSCKVARTVLAVWRADWNAFSRFDQWMFESVQPRSAEEARTEAIKLVGEQALDRALTDPWIDRQLDAAVRFHLLTMGNNRQYDQIPKVIAPNNKFFAGVPRDAQQLFDHLETEVGLSAPVLQSSVR